MLNRLKTNIPVTVRGKCSAWDKAAQVKLLRPVGAPNCRHTAPTHRPLLAIAPRIYINKTHNIRKRSKSM